MAAPRGRMRVQCVAAAKNLTNGGGGLDTIRQIPNIRVGKDVDETHVIRCTPVEVVVKTLPARFRGDRTIELSEALDIPQDTTVVVVIPDHDDESDSRLALRQGAEAVLSKLWDNDQDEAWREYL